MKTDDLITRLAAEPPQPPFSPRNVVVVTVAGIGAVCIVFLFLAGIREGLPGVLGHPLVLAKTLLPALTCCIALYFALRLAQPDARAQTRIAWLWLPGALALMLWLYGFFSQPAALRFADIGAFALAECIGLIMLLSVVPCAVAITALRRGATTTPRLCAFMAGLAASSGAATGYSLFCVQDNPLFYVTWYGTAIMLSTFLSTALGARLLRW